MSSSNWGGGFSDAVSKSCMRSSNLRGGVFSGEV